MAKENANPLDAHVGYWLRFVSNHVSHAFKMKVESHGVTVAEWVVMRQLFDHERLTPSAVAEGLGMSRSAISKLAERLVAKKLVKREAGGTDRRFQSLMLTNRGRTLVPRLARLADENDAKFFAHLEASEIAKLADLLKEIVRRQGWKEVPVE